MKEILATTFRYLGALLIFAASEALTSEFYVRFLFVIVGLLLLVRDRELAYLRVIGEYITSLSIKGYSFLREELRREPEPQRQFEETPKTDGDNQMQDEKSESEFSYFIRIPMTGGESFPDQPEIFSRLPAEKLTSEFLRSALKFHFTMDGFNDNEEKIKSYSLIFDGLEPGIIGPGVSLIDGEIEGYPSPIVKITMTERLPDDEVGQLAVQLARYQLELPELAEDEFLFIEDDSGWRDSVNPESLEDDVHMLLEPIVLRLEEGESESLSSEHGTWTVRVESIEDASTEQDGYWVFKKIIISSTGSYGSFSLFTEGDEDSVSFSRVNASSAIDDWTPVDDPAFYSFYNQVINRQDEDEYYDEDDDSQGYSDLSQDEQRESEFDGYYVIELESTLCIESVPDQQEIFSRLPAEKLTSEFLRSALKFHLSMDGFNDNENKIKSYSLLSDGLEPGIAGPGVSLIDGRIEGYPCPIVKITMTEREYLQDEEVYHQLGALVRYHLELPELADDEFLLLKPDEGTTYAYVFEFDPDRFYEGIEKIAPIVLRLDEGESESLSSDHGTWTVSVESKEDSPLHYYKDLGYWSKKIIISSTGNHDSFVLIAQQEAEDGVCYLNESFFDDPSLYDGGTPEDNPSFYRFWAFLSEGGF